MMPHVSARSIGISLLFGLAVPLASATEYTLMPNPQTVHVGYFSAALKPVLTINSGDVVTIESVAGLDPAIIDASGVIAPSAVPEYARAIRQSVTDRGPGPHILTGPVFVNAAVPGDVLEVRIQQIGLAIDYGNNVQRPYTGALPDESPGVVVSVNRPFFGVMGVAPLPAMGRISSMPPGVQAGNLDNKDLVAGTTLYLPVYAAGALFSVGDAHAAQGHGEVDLSAIETGLRGKFQ
jgi:acetamidase/formamidase